MSSLVPRQSKAHFSLLETSLLLYTQLRSGKGQASAAAAAEWLLIIATAAQGLT